MEPPEKKSKTNQDEAYGKEGEKLDFDILSSLPDSILTHILSLIDTRSAVKTSVLSKRYRLLWHSLPSLNFDYFGANRFYFTSFVHHVLFRREYGNLSRFCLSSHEELSPYFIKRCISYAVGRKVQHLKVCVRTSTEDSLVAWTSLLGASSSLTTLHLNNTKLFKEFPESLSLPQLKVLKLKGISLFSDSCSGEIFSSCPNLETLVLKMRISPNKDKKLKPMNVNCPNLKNFKLACRQIHEVNVTAPKLVSFEFISFEFQDEIACVNFKGDMFCLDRVCLDVKGYGGFFCPAISIQRAAQSCINMLGQLCNVKSLFLSVRTLKFLSLVPDLGQSGFPVFANLRYMKFTVEDKYTEIRAPIDTVAHLLKRAKNKVLVFSLSKAEFPLVNLKRPAIKYRHKDANYVAVPIHVVSCILESSPRVEALSVELPEASSDGEVCQCAGRKCAIVSDSLFWRKAYNFLL